MIKLVIFDLDDTLISEKEYIKSGYTAVSTYIDEKYKIDSKETYDKLYKYFVNKSDKTFNRLLTEYKIKYTENDIIDLVNIYRNHVPSINFYDDVIATLKMLKEKNIFTGIISDGYYSTQSNKLNALNAYELFDKVILTDELGKEYWKPDPKAFEIMKQEFNIHYDEMVYVADNPKKDFLIKKYYPIRTIRIIRDDSIYKDEEYIEDIKEDFNIKRLDEVLYFLD